MKSFTKCENEYIESRFKKYRTKKIKRRIFIVIILLIFLLYLIFLYFAKTINPIIIAYGESEIQKMLVKSSTKAVSDISSSLSYDEFIKIIYDKNEDIIAIHSDIVKINQVSNSLAKTTQDELDNFLKLGINIPLGTCSGIAFLSGKGSNISFSVNPIGNAVCNFYTTFEEAGINQTSHKIFVSIETEASLILPFSLKKVKKSTNYLISESVIVGKIPNVYLNAKSLVDLK